MKFLSDILARAGLVVDGTVTLNSVANATTDTDRFIVVDSGVVKYRTGTQLLSDIGGISGNQTITLSGDATGSGTTSIAVTLANSGVTAGTYGSSIAVPVITVDAKGRVTGVTTASISGSLTFTGDVTGSGTTGSTTTLTLAASGVTAGTYNNVTVNSKGLVTSGSNVSYITSLTDTLATVTARGATTSTVVTFSGGDANNSSVKLTGYNQRGGVGYHGFLEVTSTYGTVTNPNKYFRLDSVGSLQIINSGYTAAIFSLTDAGALSVTSSVTAGSFVKSGGTSSQFLKADGSVDSSTYATQTYVGTQIANLVASAPAALDTLNELAAALGNDANFSTTVTNSLAGKVPTTRTITINGTAYDLSSDRSWTITAGVSSVNAGTGVSVNSTTGAVTVSIGQSVATSAQVTFDSVLTTNNGLGTNYKVGDDAWIGDINLANTIRITGVQDGTQGYIVFGNSNGTALGRSGTGALTYGGNTVYHAGNLTNLNQLSNGPGYITGNQTITLSGDASGSGTTSIAVTLANSGVTAGTYTKVTVDAKGRVTSGTTLSAGDVPTLNQNTTGSAGSLSSNGDYFVYRGSGTGSSIDTYTDNGFRALSYTGYSSQLWSANSGGSTGTVQFELEYNTPVRGFKVRNKTDNTSWSATGWVVMTTTNQGHISGTLATQSWVTSQGYITGSYLPLAGGTMTGQLNVHYASGRISVGNGTDNIIIGAWDGTNQRLESNTRPIYIVSYGGTVSLGRSGGNTLVADTTSLTWGGAEIATRSWVTSQGYITGYTETDTLQSVTTRGSSTTTVLSTNGGKLYFRDDSIENSATASDSAAIVFNYLGYNTSGSYFRDVHIYNGKSGTVAFFDGSSGYVGLGIVNPANRFQIGSVGSTGYGGNDLVIGNGTQVMAFYQSSSVSTWYTNTNFSLMPSGVGSTGNLGVGVTSPSYRVDIGGSLRLTGALVLDDTTSNVIQHRAGNDVNTLVTVGHGGFDHNGYLRIGGANVATQSWVQSQGYITPNSTVSGWIAFQASTQGTPIIKAVQQDSSNGYYLFQGVTGSTEVYRVDRFGNTNLGGSLYLTGTSSNNIYLGQASGTGVNIPAIYSYSANGTYYWSRYVDNTGLLYWVYNATVRMQLGLTGNLTISGTLTENSSVRWKENIQDLSGSLDKVEKLRGVTYNKKGETSTEIGLIAEEVEEVYPEFVEYDEKGQPVGLHYTRLTAVLIESVKELKKEINELKNRN